MWQHQGSRIFSAAVITILLKLLSDRPTAGVVVESFNKASQSYGPTALPSKRLHLITADSEKKHFHFLVVTSSSSPPAQMTTAVNNTVAAAVAEILTVADPAPVAGLAAVAATYCHSAAYAVDTAAAAGIYIYTALAEGLLETILEESCRYHCSCCFNFVVSDAGLILVPLTVSSLLQLFLVDVWYLKLFHRIDVNMCRIIADSQGAVAVSCVQQSQFQLLGKAMTAPA